MALLVRVPLASNIVRCWNQLVFIRHCVRALFRRTRPAWALIFVYNGSADGTAGYVSGALDASAVPVTVVSNPDNIGFPAACNQGLKVARGDHRGQWFTTVKIVGHAVAWPLVRCHARV